MRVLAFVRACLASGLLLGLPGLAPAQQPAPAIYLNQVGYYPAAPKVAVVVGAAAGRFYLLAAGGGKPVFASELGAPRYDSLTRQTVRPANFTAYQQAGTWVLSVPGVGTSAPFRIARQVHQPLAQAALKGFYFQRASAALPPAYAGAWHRPAGHPDTHVLVHPSAASAQRPAGTVLACPRGWYDAGDYNKYVVNSGITLGTLLALYEAYPAYCGSLRAHLPESSPAVPDLLSEALWNLRWLLTMQDPADGGVYHKLTNADFDGMVMPAAATTAPRYVVQKSTAATLDFAAVMAQASRVYRRYHQPLPGLADSCLRAATRAWAWAGQHPATLYQQDALNQQFAPAIHTGEYGDGDVRDEWAWAGTELYATTHEAPYWQAAHLFELRPLAVPTWAQVRPLAYYSLLQLGATLPAAGQAALPEARRRVLALADSLLAGRAANPYGSAMSCAADFVWGSNGQAANQGIALLQAYRLRPERRYLDAALANLDYLLGCNATGYCFVTGSGSRSPQHPHHRPSEADGVAAPVPGLLVAGPNPGRQDNCAYPSSLPPLAYSDTVCAYASNEIAINWQAPLLYLAAALEALQAPAYSAPAAK